jgi:hypothetical protein
MKTFAKFTLSFVFALALFSMAPAPKATDGIEKVKTIELRLRGTDRIKIGSAITAEVNSSFAGQAQLTVENAKGQRFAQTEMRMAEGKNLVKFKVSEIPAGIYFIQVKADGRSETITFVVH